ncbi:MAG TPA: hypothetical protein VEW93_03825 [Acidimicrobiales bacterium]|nr:hypothetical protein [Acidimicrobiales bacterium]
MATGRLSADQGAVIADASRLDPSATEGLIAKAKTANMIQLRAEAGRVKAAAAADPDATHRRLHRACRLTRHTASDGARHLHLQGPVDAVSVIKAELDRCLTHHIRALPPGRPTESRDTMAFDAAVTMARRTVLEHDHPYGAEYKDTRHTRLDELDRLCHTHHDLHTHRGWALVPGTDETVRPGGR